MIDFSPLLSQPKMVLLGAAGQFGIFGTLILATLLGFPLNQAASIGVIGAIDGPTAIFVATKLAAKKKDVVVKFMKYAMSIKACEAETGRVCSVPGVKPPTRLTGMASTNVLSKAKKVQFWWDQDLPSAVSTPVNMTIQSFLLPETNVKKALTKFEELVVENMGPVK